MMKIEIPLKKEFFNIPYFLISHNKEFQVDSDVPKKMAGLFSAFKSSIAKTKQPEKQLTDSNQYEPSNRSIQVIVRNGDFANFDAEKISVAIGKAFLAVENSEHHIEVLIDNLCHTAQALEHLDKIINSYFRSELFNIEGILKLTAKSQALSIFKKLKEIILAVIFTSTRNFSIQKNLSISA